VVGNVRYFASLSDAAPVRSNNNVPDKNKILDEKADGLVFAWNSIWNPVRLL